MSESDKDKIKKYVEEWHKYKSLISEYEKKMERVKQKVIDYMKDNESSTLYTDEFIIKATPQKRETISKQDLPEDIWKKYSKENKFYTYKITER